MKRIHLFTLVLLALAATACQRDDATVRLRIFAESMSDGKMVMNGLSSSWENGDTLTINGQPLTIEVDQQGQAQVGGVSAANEYNAVYPSRIYGGDTTVTLPALYHYQTVGGNQKIDLPMAAHSTGGQLQFLHLTGAICVKFTNQDYSTVVMDSIVIISNGYAISGTRPIDFSDIANQSPRGAGTAADKRVTMLFDRSVTTLAQGAEKSVLLPVAPVGDSNQFTIKVCFHINGTRYTTQRTQSTAHAMPRNDYRTAMVTMSFGNDASDYLFPIDGTTMDISSPRDLLLLDSAINNNWKRENLDAYSYRNKSYRLTADIDMSGHTIAPISGFTGSVFNGNSHTISNLTIAGADTCALFASTRSSTTITGLTLQNIRLRRIGNSTNDLYMSPFVGTSKGTTFTGCHINSVSVENPCYGDNMYFGLIAACTDAYFNNNTTTTINNCSAAGNVDASYGTQNQNYYHRLYFGGLVGKINSAYSPVEASFCTISNDNLVISSTGTVYVGGAIGFGYTTNDNLANVSWSGNMNITTGTTAYVGGLYGRKNNSNTTVTLDGDIVSGTITVNIGTGAYIGKVFGYMVNNVSLSGSGCDYSGLTILSSGDNYHIGDIQGNYQ